MIIIVELSENDVKKVQDVTGVDFISHDDEFSFSEEEATLEIENGVSVVRIPGLLEQVKRFLGNDVD